LYVPVAGNAEQQDGKRQRFSHERMVSWLIGNLLIGCLALGHRT
jgi:hypothetical protein